MTEVWEALQGASVILSILFRPGPGAGGRFPLLTRLLLSFLPSVWRTCTWLWREALLSLITASPTFVCVVFANRPFLFVKGLAFWKSRQEISLCALSSWGTECRNPACCMNGEVITGWQGTAGAETNQPDRTLICEYFSRNITLHKCSNLTYGWRLLERT